MTRLLRSLVATLGLSALLVAVLAWGFDAPRLAADAGAYARSFLTFLTLVAGMLWLGFLCHLNFVQFPLLKELSPDLEATLYLHVAPETLRWLRLAAALTLVGLFLLLFLSGELADALRLHGAARQTGLGLWLAIIMAAISWFLVSPGLRLVRTSSDPQRAARALLLALSASRINLLLALPMLYALIVPAVDAG